MYFHKLERALGKYKNTLVLVGILIGFLNFIKFNPLDVLNFYDQLETKTQVLFMGFLSFSLIIISTIILLNRINNQPLYSYTRLSEAGKQLILAAKKGESIDLNIFLKEKFQLDELKKQARILEDYGWITLEGNIIEITKDGDKDLATFIDLVYGRFS